MFLSVLLAIASTPAGQTGPLKAGDRAPAFQVAAMVKGSAPDLNHGAHLIVVGPSWLTASKAAFPRLSKLARSNRDRVETTFVAIREREPNPLPELGRKFAPMAFNVAYDGPSRKIDRAYVRSAYRYSLPTAFLIREGRILWIGAPSEAIEGIMMEVLGSLDGFVTTPRIEAPSTGDVSIVPKLKTALLMTAGLETKAMNIALIGNTAFLQGSVPDYKQRRQAERIAHEVCGDDFVVENLLRVIP